MKKTIVIIGADPGVGFAVAERFGRRGTMLHCLRETSKN